MTTLSSARLPLQSFGSAIDAVVFSAVKLSLCLFIRIYYYHRRLLLPRNSASKDFADLKKPRIQKVPSVTPVQQTSKAICISSRT